MPAKPKNILFCGAFNPPKNGSNGGVLFACRTLLATEAASQQSWKYVDSAQPLPPPPFVMRLLVAGKRFVKAIWLLMFGRIGSTLVFSPFLTASIMEKASICLVSGIMGKPTVIAFRSEIMLGRAGVVVKPLLKVMLARISYVICQSNEARTALTELFPKWSDKYVVLPNWIDLSKTDLEATRQQIQSNSTSPNTPTQISYIGWLEPIKDVPTILRAASKLKQGTDWKLVVCGDGALKEELESQTADLKIDDRVEFAGWVGHDKKMEVLHESDIFVMASVSEGMPNSLLEAMSVGLPVVASNVGGIPTLVESGKNGFLFEAGDCDEMSSQLQQLIEDPSLRTRIGLHNLDTVKEKHDSEMAARTILGLLGIGSS